jgi:hypothetical protein
MISTLVLIFSLLLIFLITAVMDIPQNSRHQGKLQKVVNCHDDTSETKV